jgi:hypothetical protein
MAIPLAVPIALSMASTIPQWMAARDQNRRANDLAANLVRPDFTIPESARRSLGSAEAQANMTRLPGQDAIEGRLDQTTANKIAMVERMSMGGPTAINAAGSAYGQQMDAENQLGVQAANMRLNNQQILRNELGQMAGWENQGWNWDKRIPFEQTATAIEALREGAMRNRNAAWKDIFGSAANLTMMGTKFANNGTGTGNQTGGSSWWDNLFGGKQGNPSFASSTSVGDSPYYNMNKFRIGNTPRPNIFDNNLIIA